MVLDRANNQRLDVAQDYTTKILRLKKDRSVFTREKVQKILGDFGLYQTW